MKAGSGHPGHAPMIPLALCALLLLGTPGLCAEGRAGASPDLRGKKILYLDSYDAAYEPSILTQKGARGVLDATGIQMEVFYLDEKNNPSEEALRKAAAKARERISEFRPDLIIASDDAASKYVIVPWYKGTGLPVVFNGVNWDAGQYGYPAPNVTGQVEVEVVKELLAELGKHARGKRIGLLTGDTSTDRVNITYYQKSLGLAFEKKVLVTRFDEWKKAYLALQKEVDMLFLRSNGGIDGWNDAEAEKVIHGQTLIPSGSVAPHMGRFVLLNFAKVREEFGEHSARTALRILHGESPAAIPLTANRQARVLVNMRLAKALSIRFPVEFLERATFVEETRP
jgi:ABC-type uncharacterized transport system substrate-binding protein